MLQYISGCFWYFTILAMHSWNRNKLSRKFWLKTKFACLIFFHLQKEYGNLGAKILNGQTFISRNKVARMFRCSHRRCSVKKVFLEISQNSQENTCARVSFLIKLQASGLQLYYKRDYVTGIFLWILRKF